MQPIDLITWVVVLAFAFTTLITVGGLVENFKMIQIKPEFLNKLFPVLILEIIAVCIPLSAEAIKDSRCDSDCMLKRIENLKPSSPLAEEILEMRDNFRGIFAIPEYAIEISFSDFALPTEASVCPQENPLFKAHVMVFNKERRNGTVVIPLHAEPRLCRDSKTNSNVYRIAINKQWATQTFGLTDANGIIEGRGAIIPPIPFQ